jgi:ATP-dependent helicase/nuclease subunit A
MNTCSSYLDWVLLALQNANEDQRSSFDLKFVTYNPTVHEDTLVAHDAQISADIDEALIARLKNEFAFKYDYAPLSKIPSKLSVSRLHPDILDENDSSLELFSQSERVALIPDILLGKVSSPSSAERGTATHLFLQFCDFDRLIKYGVEEELSRLAEKKFLPANAPSLIYTDELERFASSSLIKDIINAKQIFREQRFNVELPASDFSSDEALFETIKDESLAVQGVIDLIIIDEQGNISLIDYKTDRLTKEELSDDSLATKKINDLHSLQLSYYKKAIELLFDRECSKVFVYSTHAAKLYSIKTK